MIELIKFFLKVFFTSINFLFAVVMATVTLECVKENNMKSFILTLMIDATFVMMTVSMNQQFWGWFEWNQW